MSQDPTEIFLSMPGLLREALSCWEMFRRFGFTADQLFFGCDPNLTITMTLRIAEDDSTIRMGVLGSPWTQAEAIERWMWIADNMQRIREEVLEWQWSHSTARAQAGEIGLRLAAHGVSVPIFEGHNEISELTEAIVEAALRSTSRSWS